MEPVVLQRLEEFLTQPQPPLETQWNQGRRVVMLCQPRGAQVRSQTRQYPELVYVCCGTALHRIGENSVTLCQGELLLLGQNTPQELMPLGEGDLELRFVIKPELFGDVLEYLGTEESPLREFILKCMGQECPYGYLHYKVGDVQPVQNLMENLVMHFLEQPASRRKIPAYTLGLLFVHLLEQTERLNIGLKEPQAVLQVLQYIETNYKSGSLSFIANALHYDVAWLSREIKRRTGRTYTELVQERRLIQAAWLLRNTRQKVSDIGVAVGYENISYFHRIFAKRFGCSPKHYRDQEE